MTSKWSDKIFSVTPAGFEPMALEIFRFQYEQNPVYHSYVNALSVDPSIVDKLEKIPFLPISFFKTHEIKTGSFEADAVFVSSGTTQAGNSLHFVKDLSVYSTGFTKCFENFYGTVKDWCIIGLLPSYLERSNSSLIYMVSHLVKNGHHPESGFYLDEYDKLFTTLQKLEESGQKTLLIGVTFALLDFADKYSLSLKNTFVMETGGMKGKKEEMTREQVHTILRKAFSLEKIHSEYGMTELLSQAYSEGDGVFQTPSWMKILIRDEDDPLQVGKEANNGGALNIIDLANVYSCSFIATEDVGRLYPDGSFEVLGRIDGSDLRGCGLLVI